MQYSVQRKSIEDISTDVSVVFHFADSKTLGGALGALNKKLGGFIADVLEDEHFMGKAGESLLIHTHDKLEATRVLVLGLGKKKELMQEQLREAAGATARVAKTVKATTLAVSFDGLPAKSLAAADATQAFAEGFLLGAYQFSKYKGAEFKKAQKMYVKTLTFTAADAASARKMRTAAERGESYAAGAMLVRDLVNEPAVHMKPKVLAKTAEEIAKAPGITAKVYNEAEIKKMKMGSFLSVAAGSDEPPYFIHLKYKPKSTGKKKPKKVVICGKGITFDSGGISLKPTGYIEEMKMDMAGAAVVLGIFSQLREQAPNVEVHGVIAATENMPSGSATRPGDVVTAYNGKTIEITNTDAEGRLVLADALAWSEEKIKPDYMFDVATLTGACMVALGMDIAGVFTKNEKLRSAFHAAAEETGELVWDLPLHDAYMKLLTKSSIADTMNSSPSPYGGATEGALFLQEFVKDTPWLHLDIAGPAFAKSPSQAYVSPGATGFGVRTFLEYLHRLS